MLGGLGVYAADLDGHDLAAAGFAAWHVAMCLAIHFGGETSTVGGRIARLFTRMTSSRTSTSQLMAIGHAAR